jgi:ABC-2 type transport system permease protein
MMSSKFIKARAQYRTDFIIGMIATVLDAGLGLLGIWILFHSGSTLAGWSFRELFFIYSFTMISIIPNWAFFNHVGAIPYYVRSGQFIKYYFKPMNMLVYFIGDFIDIKVFGYITLAISSFIYASITIGIHWTLGKLVFLIVSALGASLILTSISLITSSVSLIINNNLGALSYFSGRFIEFAKYPVTIFKGFIKIIITFILPMAFIGYYPALYFLRPGQGNILMYAAPVIGIGMFIVAYQVWKIGVNRYSGTGT